MTAAQCLSVLGLVGFLCSGCTPTSTGPSVRPDAVDQRPAPFTPKLQSSTTMATWIAAWEDQRGDLHAPSTVYVEVDPTKWTYGDAGSSRTTVLRPLQVEQRPAPASEPGTNLPTNFQPSFQIPSAAARKGV